MCDDLLYTSLIFRLLTCKIETLGPPRMAVSIKCNTVFNKHIAGPHSWKSLSQMGSNVITSRKVKLRRVNIREGLRKSGVQLMLIVKTQSNRVTINQELDKFDFTTFDF